MKNKVDGILVVDKPMDWTSYDVVNCIKRRFNVEKIGHCGTLDPIATGLLVILLGKGTKLQDQFMGQDKVYAATMRLGVETDSEDRTGQVIATADCTAVTEAQIRETAQSFIGPQLQTPPMVSAIKLHGQPLYKLARKGQTVERQPREITIHSFDVTRVAERHLRSDHLRGFRPQARLRRAYARTPPPPKRQFQSRQRRHHRPNQGLGAP